VSRRRESYWTGTRVRRVWGATRARVVCRVWLVAKVKEVIPDSQDSQDHQDPRVSQVSPAMERVACLVSLEIRGIQVYQEIRVEMVQLEGPEIRARKVQ